MHCLVLHSLLRDGNLQAWPECCCRPRGTWVAATTYWRLTTRQPLVSRAFPAVLSLFLKPVLWGFYCLPHFINKEAETQRGKVICSRSPSSNKQNWDSNSNLSDPRTLCYTASLIGSFQSEINWICQFSTFKYRTCQAVELLLFGLRRNDYLKEAAGRRAR